MTSPVILHVPHASRVIPSDVRGGIVLSDSALEVELDRMTDSFTDLIADQAASAVTESGLPQPTIVAAHVSRLVVDVERFTDGTEPMERVGMGPIYTRTHDQQVLRETTDPSLLDRWFHPHALAVEQAVTTALETHDRAVVIDVHSYPTHRLPYETTPEDAPRPPVCLGVDDDHTPAWLVDAAEHAFEGYGVAINTPFAGAYVPLKYYQSDTRVFSIMIEIRRDQYMDEQRMATTSGLQTLVESLAQLVVTATSDPA